MGVFINSLIQLTQGKVVTYTLYALSMALTFTNAFCSACTASQKSSPCPDGYCDPGQGRSVQCANFAGVPLYPVLKIRLVLEVITQPTCRLAQVDRVANTSAVVIIMSCMSGLLIVSVQNVSHTHAGSVPAI